MFLDLAASNIVPNQGCVVVNMLGRRIAIRGGEIVSQIPVVTRGQINWARRSPPQWG
jgi:hypothetical protein